MQDSHHKQYGLFESLSAVLVGFRILHFRASRRGTSLSLSSAMLRKILGAVGGGGALEPLRGLAHAYVYVYADVGVYIYICTCMYSYASIECLNVYIYRYTYV